MEFTLRYCKENKQMHINFKTTTVMPRLNFWSGFWHFLNTNELKVCDNKHHLGINSGCPGDPGRRRCPLKSVPFWTPPGRETAATLSCPTIDGLQRGQTGHMAEVETKLKQSSEKALSNHASNASCAWQEAHRFSLCKCLNTFQGSWNEPLRDPFPSLHKVWSTTAFLMGCRQENRPKISLLKNPLPFYLCLFVVEGWNVSCLVCM